MAVPDFLLRRLYKKGSLRVTEPGRFAFGFRNPLGTATLVGPPIIVVNGIRYDAKDIDTEGHDLAAIRPDRPMVLSRGTSLDLEFDGHLMRGANRIHIHAPTKEWGVVEIYLEERPSEARDGEEE